MPVGYWCPVLHAHLPYVRHPEYPEFLEEDWFFEALTETYVPLVDVLDGLLARRRGLPAHHDALAAARLDDDGRAAPRALPALPRPPDHAGREGGGPHRSARTTASTTSRSSTSGSSTASARSSRDRYSSNILSAFRKHRDAGKLEIITCGATHGFFPLMDTVPAGGARPGPGGGPALPQALRPVARSGIWLPECGYLPGQERFVSEAGIRFTFLESHGLTDAHPRPRYGVTGAHPFPGRRRVLRPRHGVLAPGLERGGGLSRRLRLPRVLQGHRLGAARRVPGRRAARRAPQERRHQVLPRHGEGLAGREAALRAGVGAGQGGPARRPLPRGAHQPDPRRRRGAWTSRRSS